MSIDAENKKSLLVRRKLRKVIELCIDLGLSEDLDPLDFYYKDKLAVVLWDENSSEEDIVEGIMRMGENKAYEKMQKAIGDMMEGAS